MAGITVLGLGNLLLQDEGFGVHTVRLLQQQRLPGIELIDGGTGGLGLLDFVEKAECLLIVDCINQELEPGSIIKLTGPKIPIYTAAKLSRHQINFPEVLALAQMRNNLPKELVVIGIQPHSLEWGCELSPVIAAKLPEVMELINIQLQAWA